MKAANFLNVLLAIAVVLLSALLYAEKKSHAESASPAAAPAAQAAGDANVTIDSTGLAPGVTGFGGPVPVTVELTNGVVARVAPKLPNDETPVFFARLEAAGLWKAWDGLPAEVAATTRVDAVTSATYSSEAAIANVRAALSSASAGAGNAPTPEK